jgi:hypothetical protein
MADSRNAANIQFRGVTATPQQILGTLGSAGDVLDRARCGAYRPCREMRID